MFGSLHWLFIYAVSTSPQVAVTCVIWTLLVLKVKIVRVSHALQDGISAHGLATKPVLLATASTH